MSAERADRKDLENIRSRIWCDEPEAGNPFAARRCICRGYDVYGELLRKASWSEYLYLLFVGERPDAVEAMLLERLAIALANSGPRDHSVQAAMNAGVGGSSRAACLMAALAVGAGNLGGAHEVFVAMQYWNAVGRNLEAWCAHLTKPPHEERADVWGELEHAPGFDPNSTLCATPVRQTLTLLSQLSPGLNLRWLHCHRERLEVVAQSPLAISGVAAAALTDLGLKPEQGEMLYLLLRLPGAAVHALEQEEFGFRNYPFHHGGVILTDDPAVSISPDVQTTA